MSMRDFVNAQSCGTANPLGALARNTTDMQQQLQDSNAFHVDSALHGEEKGMPSAVDMLMNANVHAAPDVGNFMSAFNGGAVMPGGRPKLEHARSMPVRMMPNRMPPPSMMQHQPPPMFNRAASALDPNAMAAEFERMHMGDQMVMEYEQAFAHAARPPHMAMQMRGPPGHQWANEFHQQQLMPPPAALKPQHSMEATFNDVFAQVQQQQHQQLAGPGGAWAAEYEDQQQRPQAPAEEPVTEDEVKYLEKTYGEIYQQVNEPAESEWVSEYVAEQQPAGGMGMGVDKSMIEQLRNSSDPKWRNSRFLHFLEKVQAKEIDFEGDQIIERKPGALAELERGPVAQAQGESWADEYQTRPPTERGADWAEAFHREQQQMGQGPMSAAEQDRMAEEYLRNLERQDEMQRGAEWANEYEQTGMGDFDWAAALEKAQQDVKPVDPEYVFQADNPFLNDMDPFATGVRLLKEGELKDAILAFEAACQKAPDNAEAWRYLGQAQAENEQETQAIAALLHAIRVDPYNLDALLMLGVSYTNDLEERRALTYLKTWLLHNPEYQGASLKAAQQNLQEYEEFYGQHEALGKDDGLHAEVTKMFLHAMAVNPNDADLHTVLGVLYHISNDYDKAIDCFRRAVEINPSDPTLWNKLGATQANSNRSQQAVGAYLKALELKPNYVRASANLAISYANQGLHEDAAKMYLLTLKRNPNADHIWSYLRITLSHMGRDHLVQLTHKKDPEQFRSYFNF